MRHQDPLVNIIQTAAHQEAIGADLTTGLVLAGVSAGANLAATVSHLWRDEDRRPSLTGLYLSIPSLLSPEAVSENYKSFYNSREQNKNAPILNQGALALFRSKYKIHFTSVSHGLTSLAGQSFTKTIQSLR